MFDDFEYIYWKLQDKLEESLSDVHRLASYINDLRKQYYYDMISKDISFLLYKGYDKKEITDELQRIYKDEVNLRFVLDIINNLVKDDE